MNSLQFQKGKDMKINAQLAEFKTPKSLLQQSTMFSFIPKILRIKKIKKKT